MPQWFRRGGSGTNICRGTMLMTRGEIPFHGEPLHLGQNLADQPLEVTLVLKDRGWILEKMAVRLAENLPNWNVRADIAFYPSPTADINHWMWYYDIEGDWCLRHTLNITHVDRAAKLLLLKDRLKKAELGICMSRMTVADLVRRGMKGEKLCFISPGHDGRMKPRRIVVGITSRVRADKAKREDQLTKLARTIRLDAFHFEIIGRGWEDVIPCLESAGATVRYYPGTNDGVADYEINLERVPTFDYYLYLGFDEGSMGFLDALAAGVPTIVTPQGFHLDIDGGITYPFSDSTELIDIFLRLVSGRQRLVDTVAGLTWNEYARKHAIAWRAVLSEQHTDVSRLLNEDVVYTTSLPKLSGSDLLLSEAWFYMNLNREAFYEDVRVLVQWLGLQNTIAFRFARFVARLLLSKLKFRLIK